MSWTRTNGRWLGWWGLRHDVREALACQAKGMTVDVRLGMVAPGRAGQRLDCERAG